MMQRFVMTRRSMLFSLAGLLLTTVLTLWGCGGGGGTSSYTDPNASITTTKTATALIEPATLKQWMDEGKVNNPDPATRDRVVLITPATAAQYAAQHIPGAQLLNSSTELNYNRLEGVTAINTMVMDGPSIDVLVKRFGINQNTTIVFVPSKGQNAMNSARAYFTFRYWGFPKERLKILNGGETAWETASTAGSWSASYALTATVPAITASTFSVKNLYNGSTTTNFNVRFSIGQMIDLVDKINAGTIKTDASGVAILDERGGFAATIPYIANAATYNNGTNTVLDSHANYYGTVTGSFKDTATLTAHLANFGVTASKSMNYVYCLSGMRASTAFFVLDGILGWPVTLYDGSWQQWNGYTSLATSPVTAAWRTNVNTSASVALNRSANGLTFTNTTYTESGNLAGISSGLAIDPVSNALYGSITDPRANQMLNEDKAYFTSGGTTTGGGGGGGTGSGC
ncbi:selenite/tellurite reduction operon rhodanese-like protein ExtH [Trichlorobacter lovleyi]|jgi:Rhodanese-related sulfurtransferase|uniref:selenite/tellurite reduction operon rhodanese-like protein ExtH n=1 Tax=Trichlorobacter lovleyi TaxID=313985 RepID=UPI003D0CBB3D